LARFDCKRQCCGLFCSVLSSVVQLSKMKQDFIYRKLPDFLTLEEQTQLLQLATNQGWEPGRQKTGYQKLSISEEAPRSLLDKTLALLAPYRPLKWDCFLLRYPTYSEIPDHLDPPLAEGWRHLRLNAVVKQSMIGGDLFLDGEVVLLVERDAILFWPDQSRHQVSYIERGERLLWSVGCNYVGA
jgi:hypothetical protein